MLDDTLTLNSAINEIKRPEMDAFAERLAASLR